MDMEAIYIKKYRTVRGLVKAIQKGEQVVLKVWDIMPNRFDNEGAYLNLGEGRYAYVVKETWKLIRNHIINQDGQYCKNLLKYQSYYHNQSVKTTA